jgi:hypothetical protein
VFAFARFVLLGWRPGVDALEFTPASDKFHPADSISRALDRASDGSKWTELRL